MLAETEEGSARSVGRAEPNPTAPVAVTLNRERTLAPPVSAKFPPMRLPHLRGLLLVLALLIPATVTTALPLAPEAPAASMLPWLAEGHWIGRGPADLVGVGRRRLRIRQTVDLPNGNPTLLVSADDRATVFLNGVRLGETSEWTTLDRFKLGPHRNPDGPDVLAVELANGEFTPSGVAGCIATVTDGEAIEPFAWLGDGAVAELAAEGDRGDGWAKPGFDDSAWSAAAELCRVGAGPWGTPDWAGDAEASMEIPEDFLGVEIPGHEREAELLRDLYWNFHREPSRNVRFATPWLAWMVAPLLAPAPAEGENEDDSSTLARWRRVLSSVHLDAEGYVWTHMHYAHAHDGGWVFPIWPQVFGRPSARGLTAGWHFNADPPGGFLTHYFEALKGQGFAGQPAIDAWEVRGLRSEGIAGNRWRLVRTGEPAALVSPEGDSFDSGNSPFFQVRWGGEAEAAGHLDWQVEGDEAFSEAQSVPFGPEGFNVFEPGSDLRHSLLRLHDHPRWRGTITRLRIRPPAAPAGSAFTLDSAFTVYDTRHQVNQAAYVLGSADFFHWTGDAAFLREQLPKLRRAIAFAIDEFGLDDNGVVTVPWVGHAGLPGWTVGDNGERTFHHGRGIGGNYWDLLPIGHHDFYTTVQTFAALRALAELERAAAGHPEWNIAPPEPRLAADTLDALAGRVRAAANEMFWQPDTGRFALGIGIDGIPRDHGYTFVNLEAIRYGLADAEKAAAIMSWIDGTRTVAGDTSAGDDLYRWRFGPRASTRRNTDWYAWPWLGDEVPWGEQVQDGGAVFGFGYDDLMARRDVLGAENAGERLAGVLDWWAGMRAAGGVRPFYESDEADPGATLQGGGTAGGLGVDAEFHESVLVPFFLVDGILGFRPMAEGLRIEPALPSAWPSLTVRGLAFRGGRFDVEVTAERVTLTLVGGEAPAAFVFEAGGRSAVVTVREGEPVVVE